MGFDENLLTQMSDDIEIELSKKRLTAASRRALQMDRLVVMFIRQSIEDRRRIKTLEDTSWGYKVYNNPKLSIFLFSIYLIISTYVDLKDVVKIVLGL